MAQSRERRRERLEYDPLDPAKQHEPKTVASAVSALVDGNLLAGASAASLALTTWKRVAGRRAAKHTVAVWLSEPKGRANLPDLVVYLDGHALMVDLTTNAELYVDRLAHAGLEVGHVRFKLSKKAGQPREESPSKPSVHPAEPPLPPLTPMERAHVTAATNNLPPEIRENASKAMEMSLRRAKLRTTDPVQTSPQNP